MIKMENLSSKNGYDWFWLDATVQGYTKNLVTGDELDLKIVDKEGKDTVIFIKKLSDAPKGTVEKGVIPSMAILKPSVGYTGKSPEERNDIRNQAIMKASAEAVSRAMQGQVDIQTLGDMIISLFDRLRDKLNNG
jgi:hypothetical protein